jgi:acyl-CoA dehydrogenase
LSSTPSFSALLDRVHAIGRDVVAPHAAAVDRDARFPVEAFAAFKEAKLLSCYVPTEYGGMGLSFVELTRVCEVLGAYCGSTAMIFAMHQIQVGCVQHHALSSEFFRGLLRDLVERQLLLASATTEVGIGGDVRTSTCSVAVEGERFTLVKKAPVISYAESADAILITARRDADSGPHDQVHVYAPIDQCTLEPMCGWDTLGFRGTCSSGFTLTARCEVDHILPVPYAEIHTKTMHPFSHIVWSALWAGLAGNAVSHARATVRAQARKTPGTLPPSALRLAEVDAVLSTLKGSVFHAAAEYQERLDAFPGQPFPSDLAFSAQVSNLKVSASQSIVDIVGKSLMICGISGYRNDHKHSLGRHLRDSYGAALMVNNDRILVQSSTMQLMRRGG